MIRVHEPEWQEGNKTVIPRDTDRFHGPRHHTPSHVTPRVTLAASTGPGHGPDVDRLITGP